jgi:hypothetical protein
MILRPNLYVPQTERDKKDKLSLSTWDLLRREEEGELEEAKKRINGILKNAGLTMVDIETEHKSSGKDWLRCGEDVIDLAHFSLDLY